MKLFKEKTCEQVHGILALPIYRIFLEVGIDFLVLLCEEEVFVGVSSGNCRVFPLFSETSSHF